jgi:adenine phosphoribosyltransferase
MVIANSVGLAETGVRMERADGMQLGIGLDSGLAKAVQSQITVIPDFPKQGIMFQDLCPVFANPGLMRMLADSICAAYGESFNKVLAVEARGFVIGALVAAEADVPLILARKKGKLPGLVHSMAYALEYGSAVLEIQAEAVRRGDRVLLVDDVLATGGTLAGAAHLVRLAGGVTTGHAVIAAIEGLGGPGRLAPAPLYAALSVS